MDTQICEATCIDTGQRKELQSLNISPIVCILIASDLLSYEDWYVRFVVTKSHKIRVHCLGSSYVCSFHLWFLDYLLEIASIYQGNVRGRLLQSRGLAHICFNGGLKLETSRGVMYPGIQYMKVS